MYRSKYLWSKLDYEAKRLLLMRYHNEIKELPQNLYKLVEYDQISDSTLDIIFEEQEVYKYTDSLRRDKVK